MSQTKFAIPKTALMAALATIATAALDCTAVRAQDNYPAKPVTLIVPYPAGGCPTTCSAALIGQKLSERLKQQFIIDNRPGAGTLIGASQAAHATPDGYTLFRRRVRLQCGRSRICSRRISTPINDFAPIGMFGSAPTLLTTYNESPYKTLKDVVDRPPAPSPAT